MQPFEDIRVLDLTHVIAGPFCTYQLAVLGADVIKVEPPDEPDMVRWDGPDLEANRKGMGAIFAAQASNKRAITLDLKTREGKEILQKLIATADVLVENYRSGSLDALGLGYEDVQTINSKLIYCSLTGFGQNGCKSGQTAYDNVIQAFSGLMMATGTGSGEGKTGPVRVGPPVLDYGTGAQAAFAIAAALYQRNKTGEGQRIDIAMLDAALMMMSVHVHDYYLTGKSPVPPGNDSLSISGYGCFKTANGLLMVGAWSGKQASRLWRALGEPEVAKKIEKLVPSEMKQRLEKDKQKLSEIFLTKPACEWEVLLNDAGVPAARVREIAESVVHEQVQSRGVIQSVPGRQTKTPVAAFQYHHGGPALSSPPPNIGEHTNEVLAELGYSESEIKSLRESHII